MPSAGVVDREPSSPNAPAEKSRRFSDLSAKLTETLTAVGACQGSQQRRLLIPLDRRRWQTGCRRAPALLGPRKPFLSSVWRVSGAADAAAAVIFIKAPTGFTCEFTHYHRLFTLGGFTRRRRCVALLRGFDVGRGLVLEPCSGAADCDRMATDFRRRRKNTAVAFIGGLDWIRTVCGFVHWVPGR